MNLSSDTRLSRARAMSPDVLGAHVPIVDLSGPIMVFSDGSLGVGFSCNVPVVGMLDNDTRAAVFEGLRTAFKLLPEGACAQVYFGQHSRPSDVEEVLGAGNAQNALVTRVIEQRRELFVAGLETHRLRATTCDIYLNLPPPVAPRDLRGRISNLNIRALMGPATSALTPGAALVNKLRYASAVVGSFANPMAGAVVMTLEEYQGGHEQLRLAASGLLNSLRQAGVQPSLMSAEHVLQRLYRRYNPRKYECGLRPRTYEPQGLAPIAETFVSSGLDWDPERVPRGMIYADEYYHQLLTLKNPPTPMHFPHLERIGLFTGLQKMDIVVNISPSNTAKRLHDLQQEIQTIEANDKTATAGTKLAQLRQEVGELAEGEDRTWQVQHIFIPRDREPDALRSSTQALLAAAMNAREAELLIEDIAIKQYWMASHPGWCRDQDFNRHNIVNTRQLVAMAPIFGSSFIDPQKPVGAVFETGDGGLFNLNPGDRQEYPSSMFIIAGGPGTGKSVLTNSILTQLSRYNPRIILIDIGASYRRFCESLGGTFIEYNIKSDDCRINLFDVYTGRTPDMEEQQSVILLLGKMVAMSKPKHEGLTGPERSQIEDALNTIARNRNGKPFYMSDFAETLAGFDTAVARGLVLSFTPFCRGGTYANLFDGFTKVPTGARVTVFELGQVSRTAPELLPVVFQAVMQHTGHVSSAYPDDVKIMGMDETHQLLKDPILREFVELVFRTFRKLGVWVFGVSQGFKEWMPEGNEGAILDNVTGFFVNRVSDKALQSLTEYMDLSPEEAGEMATLQVVPGIVSEFMAIRLTSQGRRLARCANRLSAIEYAMFTTDPEDMKIIHRWARDAGGAYTGAVERFAQKYPRGVLQAGGPAPEDRVAA